MLTMPNAAKHETDGEFREWLRKAVERERNSNLPPEEEELSRPRYDDPDVRRRIADLIGRIAEKPRHRRR